MKSFTWAIAILLAAGAAFAQTNAIVIRGGTSQFTFERATLDDANDPIESSIGTRSSYGIAYMHSWSPRFSTTIAADRVRGTALMTVDNTSLRLGTLKLTPLTAIATIHFAPAAVVDPYLGAGPAWVSAKTLRSADIDRYMGPVSLRRDFTYVVSGGVNVPVGRSFVTTFDVRFMPVSFGATAAYFPADKAHFKFHSTAITLGAGWRF
jgi:outer membrane protein W